MSGPAPVQRLPAAVLMRYSALSAFAMLLLLAGALALTQPNLVPALAKPAIAWPLLIVGGMLESGAVAILLGALRTQRREIESNLG